MHNENKANCNENFRICAEEPIAPLYNQQASIDLWGQSYYNYKFSSGPFWTHKIKTKAKYISISNILHLLSAPASIPHVDAVLVSLVVVSSSNCKFSTSAIFHLIVDLHFHPSRALSRSLESFTPLTWMYFCYPSIWCSHCGHQVVVHVHNLMELPIHVCTSLFYWMTISSSTITAPFLFEQQDE